MSRRNALRLIPVLVGGLAIGFGPVKVAPDGARLTLAFTQAVAEPAADAAAVEKQAFDAAKDLGTVEAWDAFLANYPKGFHADLARAYVKKLAGSSAPAATSTPPLPTPAAPALATAIPADELPCREAADLRSKNSNSLAKLTFINASNATRSVVWLDFEGKTKPYATLAPGQQVTIDTYLTHPWVVNDASGDCSQVFTPNATINVARLDRNEDAAPARPQSSSKRDDDDGDRGSRKTSSGKSKCINNGGKWRGDWCDTRKRDASAAASCKELGLVLKGGKCVAKAKKDIQQFNTQKKKGCPPGTYLNPLGQCQPDETGG